MQYKLHKLHNLHKTLCKIEETFLLIAAHEDELKSYGLRRISKWLNLADYLPSFESFPIELDSCLKIILLVDMNKHNSLNKKLHTTGVTDLINRFLVKLKIAETQRPNFNINGFFLPIVNMLFRRKSSSDLFASDTTSVEVLLSVISEIKTVLMVISDDIKTEEEIDIEYFKPTNIDIEQVNNFVKEAEVMIKTSNKIPEETKKMLQVYLNTVITEIAKQKPGWRKIIGGIVIVSTILSGIAATPQAVDSLDKAVSVILGSEKTIQDNKVLNLTNTADLHLELKPSTTQPSKLETLKKDRT
ncbi:MAG: hypothetical protein OFPI_00030 [Osedax symbiont Rs2]|nr:MAG: hypothetical protein OFPI_00030 [Osedax symbiont Rs2]